MPRLPAVGRFVSSTGVRIYRIACEVLPNLTGQVYLLLGVGPPTLVDTGSGEGNSTQNILDGLKAVRSRFGESVELGDIGRILITHGHIDHVGGLEDFLAATGAEVGIHPLDQAAIAGCKEHAMLAEGRMRRFFEQAGVEPGRRQELIEKHGHPGKTIQDVQVTLALDDGQQCDGLQFIHTPGHSPGHVCIAVGDVLLSGDHILARTIPQQCPQSVTAYTGLGYYLDSLAKIRNWGNFHLALGGHESAVQDVQHRIDQIRQSLVRKLDRLMDFFRAAPRPLTVYEIGERIFMKAKGFYALLALTDIAARVEYLYQRGQLTIAEAAEVESEEEGCRYRPA